MVFLIFFFSSSRRNRKERVTLRTRTQNSRTACDNTRVSYTCGVYVALKYWNSRMRTVNRTCVVGTSHFYCIILHCDAILRRRRRRSVWPRIFIGHRRGCTPGWAGYTGFLPPLTPSQPAVAFRPFFFFQRFQIKYYRENSIIATQGDNRPIDQTENFTPSVFFN